MGLLITYKTIQISPDCIKSWMKYTLINIVSQENCTRPTECSFAQILFFVSKEMKICENLSLPSLR